MKSLTQGRSTVKPAVNTRERVAAELRAAAENLERARQLVRKLAPGLVDDDSALSLWLDAPKVSLALWVIARTLDPEPVPADDGPADDERIPELPPEEQAALDRSVSRRFV